METLNELSPILNSITWSGVGALFVWKILYPWTEFMIKRMKSKGHDVDLAEKVELLESNHLQHVKWDIENVKRQAETLWREINHIKTTVQTIEKDVAFIKGTLKHD